MIVGAVEYESADGIKTEAAILRPIAGVEVEMVQIKSQDEPPRFVYGELVSVIGQTDVIGEIRDIIWHYKEEKYHYYISVGGSKKSRRYYEEELKKLSGE